DAALRRDRCRRHHVPHDRGRGDDGARTGSDVSTVVVTGANRGLGLELARVYASRGDRVIAACRNPAAADELAAVTDNVHAVDMGDEHSITDFVDDIGDQPVDIVLNNAGIDARNLGAADSERDVLTQTPAQLMGQVAVNAVGPWLLS